MTNWPEFLRQAIDALDAATWKEVGAPVDPDKLRSCRAYQGTSGDWTYMLVVLDAVPGGAPAEAVATAMRAGTLIRLPMSMAMKARALAEKTP